MMKQNQPNNLNSKTTDNLNLTHHHHSQSDEENKLIVSLYNSSISNPVETNNSLSNIVDNCDIINDTHHHDRLFEPFSNRNVVRLSDGHVMDVRNIEQMLTYDTIHSMEVNKSNQIYLWRSLLALFQGNFYYHFLLMLLLIELFFFSTNLLFFNFVSGLFLLVLP